MFLGRPANDLLQKPLIIGASVSSGFLSKSPGDRLAERYTSPENIVNRAVPGAPSFHHLPVLNDELVSDRSLVIAMDLMFWDSVINKKNLSLHALSLLIDLCKKREIPLIVGDIPDLLRGRQVLRQELNALIRQKALENKHIFVLPLEALHHQVMRDRYLLIGGKRHSFHELVPDGLHLADLAGEFLADFIHKQPLFTARAG